LKVEGSETVIEYFNSDPKQWSIGIQEIRYGEGQQFSNVSLLFSNTVEYLAAPLNHI